MTVEAEDLAACIATALATIKAYNLPEVTERLGLSPGDNDEAHRSKRLYVLRRIRNWSIPALQKLGESVLNEVNSVDLREQLDLVLDTQRPTISRITRVKILELLDQFGNINGNRDLLELLQTLWPVGSMPSTQAFKYDSLADEIWQHMVRNSDWSPAELFRILGLEQCSQHRFFRLLEECVDPRAREGEEQGRLVDMLNDRLRVDGFELSVQQVTSGHPIYKAVRRSAGVATGFKQLIFAADGPKPDLVLSDAISNEVTIVRHQQHCLVYHRPVGVSGVTWGDLVAWWASLTSGAADDRATARALYDRLRLSLASEPETILFKRYYRRWLPSFGPRTPALIPQVYLHYDPLTVRQRVAGTVLPRQRMDFLLLFSPHERVVLEVDGKQHYADGDAASPRHYAEMAAADRELRLGGYEVYRFGGFELLRPGANSLVDSFFERLFARHSVSAP